MALWVVRAGKHGEQRDTALQNSVVCHKWNTLPDYSSVNSKDELSALFRVAYPEQSGQKKILGLGQVWRFAKEIAIGDLVALPLTPDAAISFGRITGPYKYQQLAPNVMHTRPVEWIKSVPRSAIPEEVLRSMNAALTIFQVSLNDAEARIKRILNGDDGDEGEDDTDDEEAIDLEQTARDQIIKSIESRFKTHDLARLVDAVLRAQGFKTEVSPPGPDGGVDILAGSGSLGLDLPRLCVQVKSGGSAEGQKTYNELLGVVSKFASQQGLLVSWGGFTAPVKKDAQKDFFRIRLWDQGDLVNAVLENYERLDDETKAELPLKRVWMMVNEPTA